MLYDQAQLAISYLEAFQITHDRALGRRDRGEVHVLIVAGAVGELRTQ